MSESDDNELKELGEDTVDNQVYSTTEAPDTNHVIDGRTLQDIIEAAKMDEKLTLEFEKRTFLFGTAEVSNVLMRADKYQARTRTFEGFQTDHIIKDIIENSIYSQCPVYILAIISMMSTSRGEKDLKFYLSELSQETKWDISKIKELIKFASGIYGSLFLKKNKRDSCISFVECCCDLKIEHFDKLQLEISGKKIIDSKFWITKKEMESQLRNREISVEDFEDQVEEMADKLRSKPKNKSKRENTDESNGEEDDDKDSEQEDGVSRNEVDNSNVEIDDQGGMTKIKEDSVEIAAAVKKEFNAIQNQQSKVENLSLTQRFNIDSDDYKMVIEEISADVLTDSIHNMKSQMSYDGFNPKEMRNVIAKRLDDLDVDKKKSLYLLVATTVYRGTNISKIQNRTAQNKSLELFKTLIISLPLALEKTKVMSKSITLGRIVASFPDVAAHILRANGAADDDNNPEGLRDCFKFSHAGSIIPRENTAVMKLWRDWSDAFSQKIKSKQTEETRKNFQTLIIESSLFSSSKRQQLYDNLIKEL